MFDTSGGGKRAFKGPHSLKAREAISLHAKAYDLEPILYLNFTCPTDGGTRHLTFISIDGNQCESDWKGRHSVGAQISEVHGRRCSGRVENRRSGFSLPVAIGMLSHGPPQSGWA